MSNIFKNFLNSMRLTDDEDSMYLDLSDEEDIDDYEKITKSKPKKISKKSVKVPRKERVTRMEKSSSGKVVPIRSTSKGLEVCILKPTSFEDSQMICDMLLIGRATVINLEGFDDNLAQRTMDFVSGSVYAINGKLHRISSNIFIVSPDNIDISGDYLDIIEESGFEPPTIQSRF